MPTLDSFQSSERMDNLYSQQVPARILVVDDEPAVVSLLVRALALSGFEAVSAHSGREALDTLARDNFDLLLTDLQMPGMRGDELQLRAIEAYPDLAVMLVTAANDAHVAVECLKAGAYDYILKPFDVNDVGVRVHKALSRRATSLELKEYQATLQRKVADQAGRIRNLLLQSMESLNNALEAKDEGTRNHSVRVAHLAVMLAGAYSPSDIEFRQKLRMAALLHDIGKIGVREFVLNKPGRLEETEYDEIKQHSVTGESILRPLFDDDPVVLSIVRHHHERWDGQGYPDGLEGEACPIGARLLAIADAFDAMISARPYRAGMTVEVALGVLRDGAGTQWDPQLVAVFDEQIVGGLEG